MSQTKITRVLAVLAGICLAPVAAAQDFNVDFSQDGSAPPQGFAGAGNAGVWNGVAPKFGFPGVALVDTSGNGTPATLSLLSGVSIASLADPTLSGPTATLLLDGYSTLDTVKRMSVSGLAPGLYDVIAYGFVPASPVSKTHFTEPGGLGTIGGTYTGSFVQGVTHGRTQVAVGADGELDLHWVNGVFLNDGFFSGFQLRRECSTSPTTYCTASSTSIAGCQGAIGGAGVASLSFPDAFTLTSGAIPGQVLGLSYFGVTGAAAIPFGTQGGFVCASPPVYRSGAKGSNGSAGSCDGLLSFSLADLIGQHPGVVSAGGTVHAAMWFRDPPSPDTYGLTDGLEFDVCP